MNFYTDDISNGYNWKGLERTIARLMGHLGWSDTTVIGGTGDKGCDILATRSEAQHIRSWVVQAKAVSGDRYIGPQALQEAIDALSFYNANIAAVATNGEFTRTARQRQEQLERKGRRIGLCIRYSPYGRYDRDEHGGQGERRGKRSHLPSGGFCVFF